MSRFFTRTMRRYIIFYMSLLIIASISLLTLFSLSLFDRTMNQQAMDNIETVSTLATENINTYLNGIENSILMFVNSDNLYNDIANFNSTDLPTRLAAKQNIDSLIRSIIRSTEYIRDVIIISENMKINYTANIYNAAVKFDGTAISETIAQCNVSKKMFLNYRSRPINDVYYTQDTSRDLFVSFPLLNYKNTQLNNIATVILRCDLDVLSRITNSQKPWSSYSAYIMDESYRDIFFDNDYNSYFSDYGEHPEVVSLDGRDCIISVSTISTNQWKVGYVIDLSSITNGIHLIQTSACIFLLSSIFLTILFTIYISYHCTAPILELTKKMDQVAHGDFKTKMEPADTFEEISVLTTGFNTMIEKINYLIQQVYSRELAQNRAEIQALQAKINPHFLYNVLQTINSLAILHECAPIQSFVANLASHFEYVLYRTNVPVPISAEIDYIRTYLSICEIRFGRKIIFRVKAEKESLLETTTFKFLLQPLVENSIKYGFTESLRDPIISLALYEEDSRICIKLTDNGSGISPERLKEIRQCLLSNDDENHFGLAGIQKRIKLSYGQSYDLKIDSREGYWTQVTLHIPVEKNEAFT